MASTEECFEEDCIQSALSSFHTSLKTLNNTQTFTVGPREREEEEGEDEECLFEQLQSQDIAARLGKYFRSPTSPVELKNDELSPIS
ncbi:hypothetical protein DPX16_18557 [Anabarilius grahami]|uniref:Uncharacterized protein n=1 Tax=Anabarilius grahami TaxID=495550 RepID=A0A3N0YAP4_ANAGA|nr:hypothetical protein DPX16_18557 [Anabarilius grahami]